MTVNTPGWPTCLAASPVRVVAGAHALDRLGELAREQGASHVLLVSDPGIERAGHVARAVATLQAAGLAVTVFLDIEENPTTAHVAAGLAVAQAERIDFLVALGGGSAMDGAKGINLLLTNGGAIEDYWGEDQTHAPLLPLIAVPTTAGTGSEAQSFALISNPVTHQKMACGDRRLPQDGGLRPRVAILDHELTRTVPPAVAAAAGIDAVSHAVETAGTVRRNPTSQAFSQAAWQRLERTLTAALADPDDVAARREMLLGAHLAGAAIETSMLGAAHACANPLTARHGLVHGIAVGVMLPHVIRFNTAAGENPYGILDDDPARLADRVTALLAAAGIPARLRDHGVAQGQFLDLGGMASQQWTAQFNPRAVGRDDLAEIYRAAW